MKKQHIYLFIILLVITIASCSKDDDNNTTPINETIKSSDKQITSFVFNTADNSVLTEKITASVNENNKAINATAPYGTDITAFTPVIQVSDKASVSPTTAQDFTNPVTYTVTAEDGTKTTYKTTVTITPNDEKQILSFVFRAEDNAALKEDIEATINEETKLIKAIVPYNTIISELTPLISISEAASITPTGIQDFTSVVKYEVTAEDKSVASYNVDVTEIANDKKQILNFVFTAEDNADLNEKIEATINQETKLISATVPYGTNITELIPFIRISEAASITPTGIQDFTSVVKYEVSAQDASVVTYDVKVNVKPNSEKQILSFGFSFTENPISVNIIGVIDEENKEITFETPLGTNIEALLPNISISEGSTISSAGFQDFTNPVEYVVTAENGTTNTYTVNWVISERDILLTIYNENPNNNFNWNLNDPLVKNWLGIRVDEDNNVIELNANNMGLDYLPPVIGRLKYLRTLRLTQINISVLPAEIGNLTKLRLLQIANNELITELPKEIGQLSNLERLSISDCPEFRVLPDEIGQLNSLTYLFIARCKLQLLPPQIGQLSNLTEMLVQDTRLYRIPKEIGQLSNLTELNLSINPSISSIPAEMGQLTNLTELSLWRNRITSIPPEIGQLTNLTKLVLTENQITTLPQAVCNLVNTGTDVQLDDGVICE